MTHKSKYICECKAVTANEIKRAVRNKGAESILDIQNLTKASTGCGRCKDLVIEIIQLEVKKIEAKGKQLRIDF